MGKPGKREFVQVLRLMETFALGDVTTAVREAIARGAVGIDAIKQWSTAASKRPSSQP